jgi:hypothetical protein
MFQTQTDINVSIYIEGDTLRDNEKLLSYLYDCIRNLGNIGGAEVELESHAYKETSHYDTETNTTYVDGEGKVLKGKGE